MKKKRKKIENHGKKQTKVTEEREKQKCGNDFNIGRDGIPLEKQKEIFNERLNERALEFAGIEDKIDPNYLIYNFNPNLGGLFRGLFCFGKSGKITPCLTLFRIILRN